METTTNITDLPSEQVNVPSSSSHITSTTYSPIVVETASTDILQQIKDELSNISAPLPSRDIPQSTIQNVQDIQTTPNYIPQPVANNQDYINHDIIVNDVISHYDRANVLTNNMHSIYEEFQYPLLIGILYFLFQLPICKTIISQNFPYLINSYNNYNLYGYIFTSFLFSISFTFLFKLIQINKI